MSQQELGNRFTADLLRGVEELAQLGYTDTYLSRMIGLHGGVAAARRLVMDVKPSEGLWQLQTMGRLDLSVEMWVLLPWYEPLFELPVRERARRKLRQLGVDVDSELDRLVRQVR